MQVSTGSVNEQEDKWLKENRLSVTAKKTLEHGFT